MRTHVAMCALAMCTPMYVWVCVLVCTTYMQGDGGFSSEFKVQGAGGGKLFNMYYL